MLTEIDGKTKVGMTIFLCDVAQIVALRLAVRQARVRISAPHPRGGPLLSRSDEDKKKRFSTNYIYKYCMYARLM